MDEARTLAPGHGSATIGAMLAPGRAGVTATASMRLSDRWSAFGQGWAGMSKRGDSWGRDWSATAGLSAKW